MKNSIPTTSIEEWCRFLNVNMRAGGMVYSSSGSTGSGRSLLYSHTVYRGAVRRTKEFCAMLPLESGFRVGMMWGYGLFPPAQYYSTALSELGCRVYPLGSGKNLATALKIVRLAEVPQDVYIGMPSYLLHVGRELVAADLLEKAAARLKFLITGGEVLTPALRHKLEGLFGVKVYDHYGMLQAPMIAGECRMQANHVSKEYVAEVLTSDGVVAAYGKGNLLLSSKKAWYPYLLPRLQTNDLVEIVRGVCACGSHRSTLKIHGRIDFILKVRGQVIAFPDIFAALSKQGLEDYFFEIHKSSTDALILHIPAMAAQEPLIEILIRYIPVTFHIKVDEPFAPPQTDTGKPLHIIWS